MHIYIYIYIYASVGSRVATSDTGVCEKNIPPEKKTCGKVSSRNTNSGAGEQFLLKDCGHSLP